MHNTLWTRKYITWRKICNTSRRQNRFTSLSSTHIYRVRKKNNNINFLHKLHIMYTEFYSVHFRDSTDHIIIYEKPPTPLNIKVFHVYSSLRWMGIFMRIFSSLIFMCATSTQPPSQFTSFFCCVPFKETMSRLGFALMKYETFYGKLCTKYIKKNVCWLVVCCV